MTSSTERCPSRLDTLYLVYSVISENLMSKLGCGIHSVFPNTGQLKSRLAWRSLKYKFGLVIEYYETPLT